MQNFPCLKTLVYQVCSSLLKQPNIHSGLHLDIVPEKDAIGSIDSETLFLVRLGELRGPQMS